MYSFFLLVSLFVSEVLLLLLLLHSKDRIKLSFFATTINFSHQLKCLIVDTFNKSLFYMEHCSCESTLNSCLVQPTRSFTITAYSVDGNGDSIYTHFGLRRKNITVLTPTCLVYHAEQKLPVQFHIGHKYVSDHPTKRGAADY